MIILPYIKSYLSSLVRPCLLTDQLPYVYLFGDLLGNCIGLVRQELLSCFDSYAHKLIAEHRLNSPFVFILVLNFVHPLFGKGLTEIVMLAGQIDEFILSGKDKAGCIYLLLRARKSNAPLKAPPIPHFLHIQKFIKGFLHARAKELSHV